nr:reverse transcriptase domain-containing protein [Tanacetum cinerariifolium]
MDPYEEVAQQGQEDPNEEHELEDSNEMKPFKEDETAVTLPPPRHHGARIPVRPQTPMAASTQALIDAFAAGSSPFPLPPTSPTYDQAPLGHKAAMIYKRGDIFEEDMPLLRRFSFTAPLPRCDIAKSYVAVRAPRSQYDFVDTAEAGQGLIRNPGHDTWTITRATDRAEDAGYVRALQASKRKMMTSIEEVNLRVSYQAQVRRQNSKYFYTQLYDAQIDHKDIRLEINVVRGQRTAYETELQKVHQAYLSSEARNRALLARLETLETHMSRMEWQRQSAEDLAVTQMMRIHTLEARARTDTVEDVDSSLFHISGCAIDNQVKFATCTLLGAALTWWNGHVRTLGHEVAYAMTWRNVRSKPRWENDPWKLGAAPNLLYDGRSTYYGSIAPGTHRGLRGCNSAITANNFELKHGILTLIQNKQFFGHDKEDPHAHVRYFNKITSTLKFPNVLNTSIKLMLFPFSLEAGGNFLDKMPRECLAIMESKSKVCYSRNKPVVAKVSTNASTFGVSPDVAELKDMVKALLLDKKSQNRSPSPVKTIEESCVTYGGAHSYHNCPTIDEATKDTVNPTNNRNTEDVQPQAVQSESPVLISKPVTSLISKPAIALVRASKPNPKALILYPSRRNDERNHEKANNQIEKFYQIFKDMSFKISFANALILMPKFASTLKSLIGNKEKLSEMARTSLNEQCSAVLLKKLPENLGDPGKFLIPCDFLGMAECLALADLGASINLMPFFVWKRLSLPDLTHTYMTLELADHLISRPVGVAEDVYVKVGSFHFLDDFVVVDFDADPRVPLILERSFLKTGRALIDVFKGKLTLRVGKEAITFNLDQTSRYSANYNDMTAKRIDVIDMDFEEYSQEVLGFSDTISSGNPTSYYDLIVSATSLTLTSFENSDFLLEEVDAFLAIEDEPTSSEFHQSYLDPERDILLLEAFLNDDPSLPSPNQRNYLRKVCKELKICEAYSDKYSVDEPLVVELKVLPPHIEYAFLEGDDKLPVIIAKDLSVEEKSALISVLKSHKRAIAWKLSDIKGINPKFCTHKILMEEDFEPTVQHQRRVNHKIHDVIKQEVIKLLKAGLIYPISDSSWVSLIHYVPKKGGFTVVENEDNELIPTRLVMGWRVCIDYRKLNEATRKDHFPLPFMDQMLERLAGNQYYYFLDHFFGYFQISIDPKDQEKNTFTCPYEMFAYRRMPFGLCNAPGTFQRCMMPIFHDMIEKTMEAFMDEFSVFGNSFQSCLSYLERMLKRLLEKDIPFIFSQECIDAFQTLKRKLTEALILIAPDWDMPFELMCDASDFAIGAVQGQRQDKHFKPIHYAGKTMTEAKSNYTTTEKEMLAVVYAFEKFRSYLILNKSIMYTDHSALKYLFTKKDSKAILLRWVLLLQEFTFKVIDTKGAENLAADHLSRLENPHQNVLDPKEINESFPLETLNLVSTLGNQSTLWFADFGNYYAGNFIVKGMSS